MDVFESLKCTSRISANQLKRVVRAIANQGDADKVSAVSPPLKDDATEENRRIGTFKEGCSEAEGEGVGE